MIYLYITGTVDSNHVKLRSYFHVLCFNVLLLVLVTAVYRNNIRSSFIIGLSEDGCVPVLIALVATEAVLEARMDTTYNGRH